MNIKLSCSVCGGEVIYEKPGDQMKAHGQLHKKDCAYLRVESRMTYFAENGVPVTSEVVE